MKKIFICLLLIVSIAFFLLGFQNYIGIHKFDHDSIKNTISFLASNSFKGRMGGTLENEEAAEYIKNQFKTLALVPYSRNYFQTFKTDFPKKISGDAYLKVVNGQGEIIKNYVYNKDFKEDMLNFKQNHLIFNKNSHLISQPSYMQILSDKNNYIIYAPKDDNLNFRSSFISNSEYSLCITVKKQCLNQIEGYVKAGYTIDCFIPYSTDTTTLKNVIGYIKGKDSSKPPIVLSAHFDHVGSDLIGNVYNGALDNASGVSFLMELSKYIKSIGTPNRDIIFAAFNGEEFGLKGSEAFVNSYYSRIKGGKDYNFDMIGSPSSVPLSIMGGKQDTVKTPLISSISELCNNEHIKFDYLFEDASDHSSFRDKNIDAVTFCDNDITRIHTSKDTAEYISTASIDRCFNIASKKILKDAYDFDFIILYNKQICILSAAAMVFLLIILVQDITSKNKK